MKQQSLRKLIFPLINVLLAALAAACAIAFFVSGNTLQSQKAARVWAGGSAVDFVQISCFLPADAALDPGQIDTFQSCLTGRLSELSLEAPEGGRLFCDAWSTSAAATVSDGTEDVRASVTAVGGDFFLFHPLKLISGSYFSDRDLMHDRVILDRELAWRLFGGTDLAGMTVLVNGQPFVVAGVVENDSDRGTKAALSELPGIYLLYDALPGAEEAGITCYEIVVPEPVSGFGMEFVQGNLPVGDGVIVQNTGRYSVPSVFSLIRRFGTGSMQKTAAAYPYWENAARYYQDWCALYLALAVLLLLLPAASLCFCLARALIRGKALLSAKLPILAERGQKRARSRRFPKSRLQ